MNDQIAKLKSSVVNTGKLLWDKDLVSGLNGNISARVDAERIVLTATKTCLGMLSETDVLMMKTSGELLEKGEVSTERLLHTSIYQNFPDINAVVHSHTNYTSGYFLVNETFTPKIFESRFYLGEVRSIPQATPAVNDIKPVIAELKKNNIVVLRNHGVVAMGKNLFDCFLLIQSLEDAILIDAVARHFKPGDELLVNRPVAVKEVLEPVVSKYKLFSQEQIDEIVRVVNADKKLKELGQQTAMNMDLAVKLDETGQIYSFRFRNGNITEVGNDKDAEFLVSAPEVIWRQVFNREIDPFVATTQKKMNLRGDFGKISKWYAPCSRVFELWQRVPVE